PELIASLDINLAPLEQSVFNDAKSENKWTEAALVKVLTVAGRTGAFADVIEDGITGLLCSGQDEWYEKLSKAINDREYRRTMAQKAYDKAIKEHITAYTGKPLANFIKSKLAPSIGIVVPSTRVSGGINVLMKHYRILCDHGDDVTVLAELGDGHNIGINGDEINVVSMRKIFVEAYFDKLVASLWSTRTFVDSYPKVGKRYYLVQNYETDFYYYGNIGRRYANLTYGDFLPHINYITISRWCQQWLKEKFGKKSLYAPNGIDPDLFKCVNRDFGSKIRILIEGDSESYYKNVDESFRIAAALDHDRYEVWYLSTVG
ncbi:MAG: glycosyltransferase, partial [Candidatus Omnitrophica bacterium]|nr:glycosyltransferase [Candidatus Omnitrophota bacterium]